MATDLRRPRMQDLVSRQPHISPRRLQPANRAEPQLRHGPANLNEARIGRAAAGAARTTRAAARPRRPKSSGRISVRSRPPGNQGWQGRGGAGGAGRRSAPPVRPCQPCREAGHRILVRSSAGTCGTTTQSWRLPQYRTSLVGGTDCGRRRCRGVRTGLGLVGGESAPARYRDWRHCHRTFTFAIVNVYVTVLVLMQHRTFLVGCWTMHFLQ